MRMHTRSGIVAGAMVALAAVAFACPPEPGHPDHDADHAGHPDADHAGHPDAKAPARPAGDKTVAQKPQDAAPAKAPTDQRPTSAKPVQTASCPQNHSVTAAKTAGNCSYCHDGSSDSHKAASRDPRAGAALLDQRRTGGARPINDVAVRNAAFVRPGQPEAAPDGDKPLTPAEASKIPDVKTWMATLVPTPDSPEARTYAKALKSRADQEKELKKLRAQYFRPSHNTEVRQVGILKLRDYTDAAIFPSLIKLFQGEGRDVEGAVLDHLRDLKTDEADATIAWAAVFGKDKDFRDAATKRLLARTKETGSVSNRVKWVVSLGLRDTANASVVAGARLAQTLQLYDAIPMLINAQVVGSAGPSRADDGGDAALAYILVGRQEAFVANLTPIVGDNAVAFNPQLGVLTEGVVLRVIDAVVITYRVEVNQALIGLSTQGWGQSTAALGWDQKAWREWYARDFVPHRKKVESEQTAAKP